MDIDHSPLALEVGDEVDNGLMTDQGYIIDLGLVDYGKALELQRRLWLARVEGRLPDLFLLLEHPHVFTLGRQGNRSFLIASPEELERRGLSLFHTERGGDVTYHGPGQLIGYPILYLKDYGYRVLRYVSQIEEVLIRVLKDFGIEGNRDDRNRGVWVNQEKIASIGVAIKRWVSFHGFALNYETDLNYFDLIHPCGLEGVKMTSMAKVLGKRVSGEEVRAKARAHFKEIFQRTWDVKKPDEVVPAGEGSIK